MKLITLVILFFSFYVISYSYDFDKGNQIQSSFSWSKYCFGNLPDYDRRLPSVTDNQGNVYVAGFKKKNATASYAFVQKYNSSGNLLKQDSIISDNNKIRAISSDANSNLYVVGITNSDINRPTMNNNFNGAIDNFIIKYDQDLNKLWGVHYGTSNQEYCWSISSSNQYVYISGTRDIGGDL